jgi:hypothetical protein
MTWDLLLNNLNGYQFRPVEILRDVDIRCSTSYVWIQTFQKPDESFMTFSIRKISVCLVYNFFGYFEPNLGMASVCFLY